MPDVASVPERGTVLDVTETSLDEWLALVRDPPADRVFVRNMFPSDRHHDEFIASLPMRNESDVKLVLRHFLISHGSSPLDTFAAEGLVADMKAGLNPPFTEHNSRLLRHHASKGRYPVWEGIGWVLDLLPSHPGRALEVLDAFFRVHWQNVTDNYLSGLFDAQAIIRQRYIVSPSTRSRADATVESLTWRQLELLCGMLFEDMGFQVEVTAPSGDEGADVIAIRDTTGRRERVVVQCKKYGRRTHIEAEDLRHLLGVVTDQKATRGVLVTTGPIRRGARLFQKREPRVEVLDRQGLQALLAEHSGADWFVRVDRRLSLKALAH